MNEKMICAQPRLCVKIKLRMEDYAMTDHLLHSRKYFPGFLCVLFFAVSLLTFPIQSIAQTRSPQRERKVQIFFAYNPTRPIAQQEVQFLDFSRGNPTSWLWDFGDGETSILQNPGHTYTTPGSYRVSLTARNNSSSGKVSRTLNVILSSSASFTYSPSYPVTGQAVQFTDTSTGGPTSWQWNFGDGTSSTSQNPSHSYTAAGSYTVTLTVALSTGSKSVSHTIPVALSLAASFTYSPNPPVVGQAVQFMDTSTGSPTSWQWSFGDGANSNSQNPSHTYATAASYTVTLTVVYSSGSRSISQTITVMPPSALSASFTYSPSSPTVGQAVQFTDTSTGSPTSWQWNFGDSYYLSSKNPSHTYATAGSYTVTLTATNSIASKSTSQTINVLSASTLTASFTYSPSSPVAGQAVQFTDTSTGNPTSWLWNFGDSYYLSSKNPSHTYAAAGSYTVTLTVANSSGSKSVSQTINVLPDSTLTAAFTYSPSSPAAGQAVQFTDTSIGSPTSWLWNFGDNTTSTSQNPSHTYAAEGSYWVNLRITKGTNSHSVSQAISISPASTITASFTYSPSSPEVNQAVYFRDRSTGSPTSWQWDFGDGAFSTVQNPDHIYATIGSYTVTLTASNSSGSNSVSQSITVISVSGIIPADRLIDWSRAGVWENGIKGIPNRTTIFCNVKTSIPGSTLIAKGDGIQDDTAALRAAISNCPVGQVVFIPQGIYRISNSLPINKGIVVRGEGWDKTKIIQYSSKNTFDIYNYGTENITNLTAGYSKGSDTVVVSDASSLNVNDPVLIDQKNDPELVSSVGTGGYCSWCGLDNGTRSMGEIKLIKAKNGNTLTLNNPLYYNYKSQYLPRLIQLAGAPPYAPVRYAGIEDLYIEYAAGTSAGNAIIMRYSIYCWVKGVESCNTTQLHIAISYGSYGNEVRYSYVHGVQPGNFTASRGYGISMDGNTTDNLIEDNILYFLHGPVIIGSMGGAGNVVAYNYFEKTSHDGNPNWFMASSGTHGAHTYMNLWEGNVMERMDFDDYWGSGSHNMIFRNWISGKTSVTQNLITVDVLSLNYYLTFVGNVLGSIGQTGTVEQIPFLGFDNNRVIWKVGFAGANTGMPTDLKVAQTIIRHGNFDYISGTTSWDAYIASRSIPDSLYLSSKPAWFRDLPWPPFKPDSQDFNPNSLNKIPAQVRFGR
jgi:PKD repeat protein